MGLFMNLAFTPEQQAPIDSSARTVRVNAFAGTGKSTMLCGYALARAGQRGLLIAFNKAIQTEAQATFPRHVTCRTSHALAFRAVGQRYAHKLQPDIKPFHVEALTSHLTRSLPAQERKVFNQRSIETLKAFLVSADDRMGLAHVSLGSTPVEKRIGKQAILGAALLLWDKMQDASDPAVPMLHDGYLKIFQLERPVLGGDFILFDEAQDTNPVTQAIITAQTHANIVYVGDAHQAIYGFRGAENAMTIPAQAVFYLTGSFRFGQSLADVANAILALKGERVALRGLGGITRVIDEAGPHATGYAYISRTNAGLFEHAEHALRGKTPITFVGGAHSCKFEMGEDIAHLSQGRNGAIRNPFIASFPDIDALTLYALTINDKELGGWARVVKQYGASHFHATLARIRHAAITYDSAQGHEHTSVVLVTAHRSKGLEFDRVALADNFLDPLDEDTGLLRDFADASRETQEEINLLYVAATRARKELSTNTSIQQIMATSFRQAHDKSP